MATIIKENNLNQVGFDRLTTPVLLLNQDILNANCEAMHKRLPDSVLLRVHMKTAKSIDVYQHAKKEGFAGITVSTLAEAAYFAQHQVTDILYAVGIVPAKLEQVKLIQSLGCDLKLITDNKSIITELDRMAEKLNIQLDLLIEIDCGGARGGVLADSRELIEIGNFIKHSKNLQFKGVMTHAGHSYQCTSIDEIVSIAEDERVAVVSAADRLKTHTNLDCEIISTGSTPTATFAKSFEGLTEIRPGVYMFADIDQYFIGSCQLADIATTVLTSVIGHNHQANRVLIDAGGLALSKDQSAMAFSAHSGYGWVCDLEGNHLNNLYVESVHQEHGLIASVDGQPLSFDHYPVGSCLRILPIHACMTVAAYERYIVHDNANQILDQWQRVNHWTHSGIC